MGRGKAEGRGRVIWGFCSRVWACAKSNREVSEGFLNGRVM